MVKNKTTKRNSKGKDFVHKIVEQGVTKEDPENQGEGASEVSPEDSTKPIQEAKTELDITEEKENHPIEDEEQSTSLSPVQMRPVRNTSRPDYKAMSGTKASILHITSTITSVKLEKLKCDESRRDETRKDGVEDEEVEVLEEKDDQKEKDKKIKAKESGAVLKRKVDKDTKKGSDPEVGNAKTKAVLEPFYDFLEKKAKLEEEQVKLGNCKKEPKKIVVKKKTVVKQQPNINPIKSRAALVKPETKPTKVWKAEKTENKPDSTPITDVVDKKETENDAKESKIVETPEATTSAGNGPETEAKDTEAESIKQEDEKEEEDPKLEDSKEEKPKKTKAKKGAQKEENVKKSAKKPKPKPKPAKEAEDHIEDTESESEEEAAEQQALMAELNLFFQDNHLNLKPRKPTRGDGNCWFRSVVDQIALHKVKSQPTTHLSLRLAICNYLKDLPEEVKNNTVDVIFKGKRRGLADLAHRQRKLGQFVDDFGIMVMATALFLNRNIQVYSAKDGGGYFVTNIDGGEGADKKEPFTVYYFKDYQHYQSVRKKPGQ